MHTLKAHVANLKTKVQQISDSKKSVAILFWSCIYIVRFMQHAACPCTKSRRLLNNNNKTIKLFANFN